MLSRALSCAVLSAALSLGASALSAPSACADGALPRPGVFKGSVSRVLPPPPVAVAAPRSATPVVRPVAAPVASYAQQVLALTNRERTARGLRALAASSCATGSAARWADVLASQLRLLHQDLGRVMSSCGARTAGENVAFGTVTPAQLVAMWMASPGHRANIVNPTFTELGVGARTLPTGRVYAVQVFLGR